MKTLYLMRHGKSSRDIPGLCDFDRPLAPRGRLDAPLMGKLLAKQKLSVDRIVSSPAVRAIDTARIIARELTVSDARIVTDKRIYQAGTRILLGVVKEMQDSVSSVLLFGHNPGFTDFANYLASCDIENIPTCGIVRIDLDVSHWKQVAKDKGILVAFEYPKKYKETKAN